MKNLTLITGGARSGKSSIAEDLAKESGKPVIYVATMQLWESDREGIERIDRHRRRRPPEWETREMPFDLDVQVAVLPENKSCVIVDCLSVYVSNLLLRELGESDDPYSREATINSAAISVINQMRLREDLQFIVVTNEVGWGVIPENRLARAFRDILGATNQLFAANADSAWLAVSGLKLRVKP